VSQSDRAGGAGLAWRARRVKPGSHRSGSPSTAGSSWNSMLHGSPRTAACSPTVSWTLVHLGASGRCAQSLLHFPENPRGGREMDSYDPRQPGDQDSAQGSGRRLASLRAELLPPLSPGGAPPPANRHVNRPCRLPKHRERIRQMSSNSSSQNRTGTQPKEGLQRRDLLLSASALVATGAVAPDRIRSTGSSRRVRPGDGRNGSRE
jgi:hypothetical protein